MRPTTLSAPLVALAAAVGLAQPPQPLPPGMVPEAGLRPGPPPEAPIAKYEPLAAFPAPTQQAVRAVATGGNWLVRMNQAQGRFVHGYRPAVRQAMDGDSDLRQAVAALGLVQAARFTGDERSAAVAAHAILALLATTRPDPADPTCRIPSGGAPVAAALALAIYDLPGADERLLGEAERLCHFLRRSRALDALDEATGPALAAVVASHKSRPDAWKAEAAAKCVAAHRRAFQTAPNPAVVAGLIPAFADFHLSARDPDAGAAVFELADWLCGVQYPAASARNPTWAGGFRGAATGPPADTEPTHDSAAGLAALGWAYQVTARNADVARAERYKQAAQDAAQFVAALQYTEPNTRHFENTFRANVLIGGFHLSPSDGDLRCDATGRCVAALARYLAGGADR